MKKLSFKKLNIPDTDVLTRLQMKKIVGGYDVGSCTGVVMCSSETLYCSDGCTCTKKSDGHYCV
jgi:hypothetical protein